MNQDAKYWRAQMEFASKQALAWILDPDPRLTRPESHAGRHATRAAHCANILIKFASTEQCAWCGHTVSSHLKTGCNVMLEYEPCGCEEFDAPSELEAMA